MSDGEGYARTVTLNVNGVDYTRRIATRMTLADFIREECGLTGTHLGCEHGVCGACTVRLDSDPVRSCLLLAVQCEDRQVQTIEDIAPGPGKLSAVQRGFRECHGLQCGFCTPGMVLAATDLLERIPHPTEEQIREEMGGNLCRCTGYQGIVKAIQYAAEADD